MCEAAAIISLINDSDETVHYSIINLNIKAMDVEYDSDHNFYEWMSSTTPITIFMCIYLNCTSVLNTSEAPFILLQIKVN